MSQRNVDDRHGRRLGTAYVPRRADTDLYQALKEGYFAYILTPRQQGKSSLMNQVAERLRQEPDFSPLQVWQGALRDIVLERIGGQVIIFMDEIDIVRSLPFSPMNSSPPSAPVIMRGRRMPPMSG